jgi:outer membrane protein assembly factor BamB
VVAAGAVFITDRQGETERALAYSAEDGTPLWTVTNAVDFDPHAVGRRHGNGPKATPVVHDGRVYTLGIAGWLQCLDAANGKRLWQRHLPAEFGARQPLPDQTAFVNREENVIVPIGGGEGAPVPLFGYTGSPVLAGDLVILSVGGMRGGTLMAFDRTTGKVVWKALDEHVSYSSPIVAKLAGRLQVVAMTGPRVVGLDLARGTLLWSYPFQIQYDESISTPIVADDTVVVTGDGKPLTALRIEAEGTGYRAAVAWRNRDLTSYLSSMVAYQGHVYGMNDGGEFVCIGLRDGKTIWIGGNHGYYSTPVIAGKRMFCLNERGSLAVLALDAAEYRLLAENRLADEETWTVPALVGGRLFVRSARGLRCLDYRHD